jgi:carboxypeptidase Q
MEADAPSANVICEVVGSEFPEEVVVVGGHLDSWDVGQGAQDDGVGCVIAWEAARLIHKLGLQPRRTIRVVLFTNEENGLRGGTQYAKDHAAELKHVVAALESDSGNGRASGFEIEVKPVRMQRPRANASAEEKKAWDDADLALTGDRERALATAREIGRLLQPLNGETMTLGGAGADVSGMCDEGVTGLGLNHDTTKYFEIHHTNADTFEKIVPEDLRHNVAVMAVMTYLLADMPGRLVVNRVPETNASGD